ncbi:hypothetical protein [Halodurantibacterium flavum]|uniref:Uncharacterized protein n=1 Tax=Halodurantibacterium flavum TaxID=1382802 RepID=A0ABW4S591_9RHOB
MKELAELEGRLAQALDRIAQGLEGLPRGHSADAAVTEALAQERARSSQLTEALHHARATRTEDEQIAGLIGWIDVQAQEMQRLRRSNAELRKTVTALREAAQAGLSDPSLVNQALEVELEALRVARSAEAAELDEILSELDPLLTAHSDGA